MIFLLNGKPNKSLIKIKILNFFFPWARAQSRSASWVTQSCLILRPHGLQHARLPCPSPTPGACSNLRPSSQWCHPTISSSVVPFSSCLQSFPASGFPMESVLHIRWPKYWSFSFSISHSNDCSGLIAFRIDWFDLFTVQGTLKSPSITVIMIVMLCSSEWFYVLHQLSLDFLKDLCSSFIF